MKQKVLAGIGIMAFMAFLIGCDEIKFDGTLGIHEAITFAQKGDDPYTCNQMPNPWDCKPASTIVLNPGQFATKITLGMSGDEKQITMEVKNGQHPTEITMEFDKNIETGDHFTIPAAQIKQNFDLTGDIVTKVDRTQEQSATESCTYQTQEIVCRAGALKSDNPELSAKVKDAILKFGNLTASKSEFETATPVPAPVEASARPPFPGPYPGPYPGPGPVCHPVWVTRYGYQNVRFYYETTTKDITASFIQSAKNLADYQGRASTTEKIYTYQSVCR